MQPGTMDPKMGRSGDSNLQCPRLVLDQAKLAGRSARPPKSPRTQRNPKIGASSTPDSTATVRLPRSTRQGSSFSLYRTPELQAGTAGSAVSSGTGSAGSAGSRSGGWSPPMGATGSRSSSGSGWSGSGSGRSGRGSSSSSSDQPQFPGPTSQGASQVWQPTQPGYSPVHSGGWGQADAGLLQQPRDPQQQQAHPGSSHQQQPAYQGSSGRGTINIGAHHDTSANTPSFNSATQGSNNQSSFSSSTGQFFSTSYASDINQLYTVSDTISDPSALFSSPQPTQVNPPRNNPFHNNPLQIPRLSQSFPGMSPLSTIRACLASAVPFQPTTPIQVQPIPPTTILSQLSHPHRRNTRASRISSTVTLQTVQSSTPLQPPQPSHPPPPPHSPQPPTTTTTTTNPPFFNTLQPAPTYTISCVPISRLTTSPPPRPTSVFDRLGPSHKLSPFHVSAGLVPVSPAPLTPPTPPAPELNLPDPVPTFARYHPILTTNENISREEDLEARRVVDEIKLDEDGEEVEYAEFTVDDLERQRLVIKAELALLEDETDTVPDQMEAAKDV